MLKRKYSSKEDVPEALVEYYKERDGSWVLDVEGSKTEDDVERIEKALKSEREMHRKAKTDLRTAQNIASAFDGIDADEAREALDAIKHKGDPKNEDVLALKKQNRELKTANDKLTVDNKEKSENLKTLTTEKKKNIIEKALRAEAEKAGVRTEAIRDVLRCSSGFDVDDTGQPVTPDGVNVADFIAAELKDAPHWLKSSQGAGANRGTKNADTETGSFLETIQT